MKFAHPDRLYTQDVEPQIKKLVHEALEAYESGKRFAALRDSGVGTTSLLIPSDARRPSIQRAPSPVTLEASAAISTSSGSPSKQRDNPAGTSFPDSKRPELDGPSRIDANAWVEDTVRLLKYHQDERRINDVDDEVDETCDWIFGKIEFQKWNAPLTDSVVFIQGGPGLGKSVLAKFLVKHFNVGDQQDGRGLSTPTAEQGRKPIVAHFFPRGTELHDVDNSPKRILMSLLYQMCESDPASCNRAILKLFNRFNQSRNLEFWWALFNDVRSTVTRDLYCIVDGLDECIKESKDLAQPSVDDRMKGFLKRLCDIARDHGTQTKTSCTKILITTRPTGELIEAAMGREIILDIQESDTISAVGIFVENGVRVLAQHKSLSSPARDFITKEITQKSGHVFQTAKIALTKLGHESYDLENREVVSRALINVNSQRSNDAYEETLGFLELAPPQDRVKAARIIRILFFLQRETSLLELKNALLVDIQDSEPNSQPVAIQSTIENFIRKYLALLVKVDKESMVSLQHQTVREFLQSLTVDKWQIYSCAERKGGHLQLALICIRYIVLRRGEVVTQEDTDAHEGDLFLSYASRYWDLHTREAGELIIPHMPIVNKLLGFESTQDTNDYYLPMLFLRSRHELEKDSDFGRLLPGSFLAANDLIHVLRQHTRPRKRQQRGLTQRLMFWRSKAVNNHAIEADFDLDMQDEKNGLVLTPLHCACQKGHLKTARLLLDCGASGEVYDGDRSTPFSMAVEGNCEEVAEMLIQRNESWNDLNGLSTLCIACEYGMSKVVRHLLAIGFDVNAKTFTGWTPVHFAAIGGQTNTLKVLLEAGGSPDGATEAGITPLHLAAQEGRLAIIEILFRFRPDMNPTPIRSDRSSPHHAAAAGGHLDVLKYLEAKCKDVQPDEDGDLPIHDAARGGHLAILDLLSDESNITATNKNKRWPIHLAAANGHLETVRELLRLGREIGVSVDVKCRDLTVTAEESPDGFLTPLYLAVALGHPKTAEYLINESADLNVRSFYRLSLLHVAARIGTSETFELLLKHNLDPFEKNDWLETPLHVAAENGSADIVDIYLGIQNMDVILDVVYFDGKSALWLAVVKKHANIAEKLISRGANVHILDMHQDSLLIASLDLEEMTVFKSLLEKKVDVNIANVFGKTALHRAAERGKLEACEMLIERGANINAEEHTTKLTPLHYAAFRGNVDVIRSLLTAGADPFQRELSGACIIDYVTTYQPIIDLLRKYRKDYQPLSSEEQTDIIKKLFYDKLHELPSIAPTDREDRVEVDVLLGCFMYVSWHLKRYDICRICVEYYIRRSADSTPVPLHECNDCWRSYVEGSLWSCKQCPSTQICNECYEKRSKGLFSRGCSVDHEFLQTAGEEWRKLEEGKVNAKGQTFWEWIAELKKIYLTGDEAELETPAQDPEKVPTILVNGAAMNGVV